MLAYLIFMLATSPQARLVCPQSESQTVLVDGIITEWDALSGINLLKTDVIKGKENIRGRTDLKTNIKCTYVKGEGIYFLITVTDSRIMRHKRPKAKKDDHMVIRFMKSYNKITVFPPLNKMHGMVKGLPRGVKAKVVKLPLGYAVEMGIPWGKMKIFDWMPQVPFALAVYDTDSSLLGKPETVMSLDGTTGKRLTAFEFAGARQLMQNALSNLGLSEADIKWDKVVNFKKGKKLERAILAGRYFIVLGGDIGPSFFYMGLAQNASDVERAELVDLDGDKLMELFTVAKITNMSSTWKFVAVWKQRPRGIGRIFAHMLEFTHPKHYLINKFKLKKKRKKYTIEFRFAKSSKTITKRNWKGSKPDNSVIDFILPWNKHKEKYLFYNGTYRRIK